MPDSGLRKRLSPQEVASLIQRDAAKVPIPQNWGNAYGEDDDYGTSREVSAFAKWWNIILARKRLVIIVTTVVSLTMSIVVYRIKPTYRATTIIEVGKENTMLIQISKDLIIHGDDSLKTKKFILRSTPLLEDVVVNLQLDRHPGFLSSKNKSSSVESETENSQKAMKQGSPEIISEALAEARDDRNRSAEESEHLEPFVKEIEENLDIEEVGESRLLKVSYTHRDAVIAAAVSNGVVQALMQRSLDAKAGKFNEVSSWLDRQTLNLKTKVDEAAKLLEDFTRDHNVVSTEGNEAVASDKLSRLHGEVIRAEADRILKQSLFDEVQRGNVDQIPEAFTNLGTVELKKRLNELNAKAAQLAVSYGPDNPQTVEVQQEIAAVQKQTSDANKSLEAKLRGDYARAVRDEQSLKSLLERAKVETVAQNQTAIQGSILKQQFETAKSLYSDFLQKTNQANLEVSQEAQNLRVIQVARVPRETTGPKQWQLMVLGIMLGLGTGVGAALISASLDTTIRTSQQVKRYIQLQPLGMIPSMDSASFGFRKKHKALPSAPAPHGSRGLAGSHLTTLNGRSAADEAYRVLRTSVLQSWAGSGPKTILVTSSQPGDGKTTTTVNTGISLAQLGSSVLIIDCDLRTPKVHTLLGVDQGPGLTSCLEGGLAVDEAIQQLQIPNLSLLPAGPVPPNPAELISSNRMKDLLRLLGRRYDHILIDSPPLINLADALILSSSVDGVILVVYGGKTTWDAALKARDELANAGANILGVVVNRFNLKRERYNYY